MSNPDAIASHFADIRRRRAMEQANATAVAWQNEANRKQHALNAKHQEMLEDNAYAIAWKARAETLYQLIEYLAARYPDDPVFARTGGFLPGGKPEMFFHRKTTQLINEYLRGEEKANALIPVKALEIKSKRGF